MTLNSFSGEPFPQLKGKGIWIRNLGPSLLKVFERVMKPTDVEHRSARLALESLNKFDSIIDKHKGKNKIPADDADDLLKQARTFLLLNSALGHHYHRQAIRLFNTTIKFHILLHLAKQSRFLHPSKGWCYGGESFLKFVRNIVQRCALATKLHNVGNKSLECYVQGLHMTLSEQCGHSTKLLR